MSVRNRQNRENIRYGDELLDIGGAIEGQARYHEVISVYHKAKEEPYVVLCKMELVGVEILYDAVEVLLGDPVDLYEFELASLG